MPDNKIHKLTAFVLEHGAMAERIIFHDLEKEEELPGIRQEEREAINRVLPMIKEDWIGVLSAAREALWELAKGHPASDTLQTGKQSRGSMWRHDEVKMSLVAGDRGNCGIYLDAHGETYRLGVWVWAAKKFQPVAEKALEHLDPRPAANAEGTFIRHLPLPREGETYDAVGQRAAQHLWEMARPVADAILAQP